jgi:ABC-type multidrug transport system ATPase subunit
MIAIRDLGLERGLDYLDSLKLEIADGEIYFLLNRFGLDFLFHVLDDSNRAACGEILFDGSVLSGNGNAGGAAFIDRVMDVADFETDARIGEWIDFLCACCGFDRESIFKTLLVCNFHERHLKKKVRELAPEIFRQVYLAVCLASEKGNIVINDFIRGAEKSFELKFNKLLLQKKAQGRAILYLGSDIFYASEIADRVGFIKDGRLLFEADAADLKEMDIKDLYLKFLN